MQRMIDRQERLPSCFDTGNQMLDTEVVVGSACSPLRIRDREGRLNSLPAMVACIELDRILDVNRVKRNRALQTVDL